MNQENWVKKDYQAGLNFIIDHEEEAASNTILATGVDVTILLPSGLPLYGTGFYGIFMLAPIVLFMLIISYFIFIIFSTQSLEIQTQILVAVGGFLLLWALAKALKILTSSRNLFPRKYFSTMGLHGIAANYSNSHFPGHSKVAIEWDQIDSIRTYSSFFLPGIFAGIIKTFIVEVASKNAAGLKIPFHCTDEQAPIISQKILELIKKFSSRK